MKSCLSKINHFCSYKTHFVTHNDLLENWMTCHLARNHVRAHDVMCIFYFWHQHVRFKIKCHVGSNTYVEMTPLSPNCSLSLSDFYAIAIAIGIAIAIAIGHSHRHSHSHSHRHRHRYASHFTDTVLWRVFFPVHVPNLGTARDVLH